MPESDKEGTHWERAKPRNTALTLHITERPECFEKKSVTVSRYKHLQDSPMGYPPLQYRDTRCTSPETLPIGQSSASPAGETWRIPAD
jgi:hypothetical protein